jgi:hypothetical protein
MTNNMQLKQDLILPYSTRKIMAELTYHQDTSLYEICSANVKLILH